MAVVETERHGQIFVVRMNRPERLNALSHEMRTELSAAWNAFRRDDGLEVAIFTGTGRGFCAGEDMKESLAKGVGKRSDGDRHGDLIDSENGLDKLLQIASGGTTLRQRFCCATANGGWIWQLSKPNVRDRYSSCA